MPVITVSSIFFLHIPVAYKCSAMGSIYTGYSVLGIVFIAMVHFILFAWLITYLVYFTAYQVVSIRYYFKTIVPIGSHSATGVIMQQRIYIAMYIIVIVS